MNQKARILLFTGEGKGKTTAALGMALRACGHGMRVAVVQFVKSQENTGELLASVGPGSLEIVQTGLGWVPDRENPEFPRHRQAARNGLLRAAEYIGSGLCDVIVLDEICYAVSAGLVADETVREVVEKAPPEMVVALTGRGATADLIELADTVTEMRCVKHGLKQGRRAQKGVEL
jgi:cob(I)alamin adenosyltransferase